MADYYVVTVGVYAPSLPDAILRVIYAEGEPLDGLVSVSARRGPKE